MDDKESWPVLDHQQPALLLRVNKEMYLVPHQAIYTKIYSMIMFNDVHDEHYFKLGFR